MNLLLFSPEHRLDNHRIRITGRQVDHLREVHGAEVGHTVRAGEIDGDMGEATVLALDKTSATLAIALNQAPPAKLPLTLVVALPRPKMLRRILRNVAEFGVGELHLINSYRVEKSYWQTPVLAPRTIREYLLQGLEQSRDTVLPKVQQHSRFKPFVEDVLPAMLKHRQGLLAHPGDYPALPGKGEQDTLVAIGPEGGFIPYEVEKLEHAGCKAFSLGTRILRVENAVTSIVARLSA